MPGVDIKEPAGVLWWRFIHRCPPFLLVLLMQVSVFSAVLATLLVVAQAAVLPLPRASLVNPNPLSTMFGFSTPIGSLNGTASATPGIDRYVVQYATAQRWKAPVIATSLKSLTTLPDVCPQASGDGFIGSEDCLYVVIFAPVKPTQILTWVHGGSLIVGGANDPMIEGSKLAQANNAAVVVVQYRLGVLGFLPASSGANGNLGVRDVVAALSLVNKLATAFGLSSDKVTVAGQSSGATLVRALLATPSASSLFSKAMLHSDTADYGFSKASTVSKLRDAYFQPMLNCSPSSSSCLNALSLSKIISTQGQIISDAPTIDAATAGPVALRPEFDGSLITSTLTRSFPSSLKPLLITNVNNEGAAFIFGPGAVPADLPTDVYQPVLSSVIPDDRAQKVFDSGFYVPPSGNADGVRIALSQVVGDLGFRCPDWALARAWAARSGKRSRACFSAARRTPPTTVSTFAPPDEIPIIFGTARNPTTEQKQLIGEVQARIAAFMKSGDPNATGGTAASLTGPSAKTTWLQTTNVSAFKVLALGTGGAVDFGGCTTAFWGTTDVPFDYQIHDL
ncbi:alpha/beta-hydrolase [Auriculariales sp. MPI-PUGE-AT-0066]|nr:alpha/beta-hydrolase [Auriculariales sp. MPI-PUGE-AT-0066]